MCHVVGLCKGVVFCFFMVRLKAGALGWVGGLTGGK